MELSSKKELLSRIVSTLTPTITLIFFFLVLSPSLCTSLGSTNTVGSELLKVAPSEFEGTVRTVVDVLQEVTSILSEFGSGFGDSRLSNAVSDCLDLLDMSSDELDWSVSATQSPKGKHNSTGNTSSDLRTWLSAALANQDTCIDGFDGTNGMVKGLVSTGIGQVMSLLQQLLTQVKPVSDHFSFSSPQGQYPSWVKTGERKLLQANVVSFDAVVAADGTGNYTKVMDAVLAAPNYSMQRYVIHIKRGVYYENVEIKKKKWNLMMVGDGMDATIISGNRSFIDGWTTFRSATFAVSGRGFIARDITFQNTAGPEKHQAVALRSDSDLSVFFRCGIFGYQDSLYTHTMRQFYRECKISGTVDFFGDATAIFQNCHISAKKGLPNQKNTITAHGRKNPDEPTGFSIQFCNISADYDLVNSVNSFNSTHTYLGRPWKPYSRTIFMQSYISDVLRPEGWLEWNGDFALDTLYYAEYMNYGPGAGVANRVKWQGYHVMNDSSQASNFTVSQFIEGNLWLPSTGVTFTAGLGVV
ncbi:pectinesterase/pectinesterase inhibitor PPE8B-like [Glycine soja]|uniref:Pectinesterase/pectinesterase inhibitor PPE8B isoform A n=2 Tax=Glycine soja TaxID=3848 RepID=A0A445GV93_GLYSO|nr:pectinesterase/pectinesterase inhibitor PPE8B-like [Glycine soja]RZB65200.1 Pectinesterase/pectinesterase inhibitor PPE8B isoform A [Glycine soja]